MRGTRQCHTDRSEILPGGAEKRGIDCFVEVIMHERQHRMEYFNWRGEDLDEDGVPRHIEAVTRGCIDDNLSILDLMGKTASRE